MSDHTPTAYLTSFLLEQIAKQPIEKQLKLYRSLAIETKDERLARECRLQAAEIEKLLKSAHQLVLDFKRRSQSANPFGR